MGKEEVAAALKKMVDDGDAADRMADDDFTDLADADLTQAERALVSAAAGEVPDVEGFGVGLNYFEQQDDGTSFAKIHVEFGPRFLEAMNYSGVIDGDFKF